MGSEQSKPWREISLLPDPNAWTKTVENELRDICLDYSNKMKILMFGPTQSGKTSLVSSLLCALTGTINQYTLASALHTSSTTTLYSPNTQVNGQPLKFKLTDMPGFMVDTKHEEDYLKAVLEGHIKEDMVVPEGPLDKTADYYIPNPMDEDLPCCVVLVMKAGLQLQDSTRKKFLLVLHAAEEVRLKVAVVLTHVDYLLGAMGQHLTGKNVDRVFHEKIVHEVVKEANLNTGIPLSFIHPVVNYSKEVETSTEMNILLLYTLSKILDLAKEGANARHR